MNYAKIAGERLFGGKVLDNAARGLFIEAMALETLRECDRGWHHTGAGWGPWDLQRGAARDGDRVRVQVKAKAATQLWNTPKKSKPCFKLGLRDLDRLPKYFSRDFPAEIYGDCELRGYRTDLFLFAWHDQDNQANPHQYAYFVVPAAALLAAPCGPAKEISVERILAQYERVAFDGLAAALNRAADHFLTIVEMADRAGSSGTP